MSTASSGAGTATKGQLTAPVVVVAVVSAVSGMLYGYDTGIISGALLQITDEFGIAEAWKQVIAASILLGAVIGALTCSWLSERRGRQGTPGVCRREGSGGLLEGGMPPAPQPRHA